MTLRQGGRRAEAWTALAALAGIVGFAPGAATAARAEGGILYVAEAAPDGGDGSSWESALRFLADALSAAVGDPAVREIRLAQGTYPPDRSAATPGGSGDRLAHYRVPAGMTVVGGWAGTGSADPDAHDPARYTTILSGDLDGNDDDGDPGDATRLDNASRIVLVPAGATEVELAHLVVERCFGETGVRVDGDAAVRLRGVVVRDCRGGSGAGLRIDGSVTGSEGAIVRDCTASGHGGGAWLDGDAHLDGVAIVANQALHGGGIRVSGFGATIVDVRVEGNAAWGRGGGLTMGGGCTIRDAQFVGNAAAIGGGVHVGEYAFLPHVLAVTETEFTGNAASSVGGAIHLADEGIVQADACAFVGNTAVVAGGAMLVERGEATMVGCAIEGDAVEPWYGLGGAVAAIDGASVVLERGSIRDCIGGDGGALAAETGASFEVVDMEVAGNVARRGGAYFAQGGDLLVRDTETRDNVASEFGGAARLAGGTLEIVGGRVAGNAAEDGGAISARDGSVVLRDVEVVENQGGAQRAALGFDEGGATFLVDGGLHRANLPRGFSIAAVGSIVVRDVVAYDCGTSYIKGPADAFARIEDSVVFAGGGPYSTIVLETLSGEIVDSMVGSCRAVLTGAGSVEVNGCAIGNAVLETTGSHATLSVRDCVLDASARIVSKGDLLVERTHISQAGLAVDVESGDARLVDTTIVGAATAVRRSSFGNGSSPLRLERCRLAGCGTAIDLVVGGLDMDHCVLDGNGTLVDYSSNAYLDLSSCILVDNGDALHLPTGGSSCLLRNTIVGLPGLDASVGWWRADHSILPFDAGIDGFGQRFGEPVFVDRYGPDLAAGTGDEDLRPAPGSLAVDAGWNNAVGRDVDDLDGDGDRREFAPLDARGGPRFTGGADGAGCGFTVLVDIGALEAEGASAPPLREDLDGDGAVTTLDLLAVLSAWGAIDACAPDLDADGDVDIRDLVAVLAAMGG